MIQIYFLQIELFIVAQCAQRQRQQLVHSINNFVTSFNHNLFINSLLQREKRKFFGEIMHLKQKWPDWMHYQVFGNAIDFSLGSKIVG